MRSRRRLCGLALVAVVAALVASCNDNTLGVERRHPNLPPATTLASGPPDSAAGVNYKVHLFWSGADPDGAIDHFDFILIDHPAIQDSIAPALPNDPHRVVVTMPTADDPRWSSTTANDTLIISRADTLRVDPAPPPGGNIGEHDAFVRSRNFERWHTFFVRAVDNYGLVDPVPEYRSFNSTTLAPTIRISPPVNPARNDFKAPRTVIFRWTGEDPVGDGTVLAPVASRWAVVPSRNIASDYLDYPQALYGANVAWSEWHRWDAPDQSGVRAIVRDLQPVDGRGHGFYLFAVQAMDEAGAVTPIFDAGGNGTNEAPNNVVKVFVNDQIGPILRVKERFLGTYSFASGSRPVVVDIATGEPVEFRWVGDASDYGGEIVSYRYGWNIRNPQNDEEWEQNWCSTCTAAPVRIYSNGTQRFFVEARDNAESITRAVIELVVNPLTRRRELLLVDDSVHFSPPDEAYEDTRWAQVIDELRRRRPFDFDSARDVYDVAVKMNQVPPIPLLFDYKNIVWLERKTGSNSALATLAVFFDPFVLRHLNSVRPFNSLDIYVQNGGKLWVCGQQPTEVLWDFGQSAPLRPYPINVTNWKGYNTTDPDVHPDSVGVPSLLWKLGVEVVDAGAGGRANVQRGDDPGFFCTGFRRMAPPGSEKQQFMTTTGAEHEHAILVQTADVNNQPPAGVTYTTDEVLGHTHSLHLSPAQLSALARGERLDNVPLSESLLPSPHAHTVTLQDRVGLWGAPLRLEPDTPNWAQPVDPNFNPDHGRPNVEIYNMSKPLDGYRLRPDPAVWLGLYGYTCAMVADSTRGFVYPFTADQQPAVIVRRNLPTDLAYSRALCGFEPFRLQLGGHIALADNILLRQFRLGLPNAP